MRKHTDDSGKVTKEKHFIHNESYLTENTFTVRRNVFCHIKDKLGTT